MNDLVQYKVALITGGGSGIGRAAAKLFAEEGALVAVSDVDSTGGEETVQLIKADGGSAIFIKANVAISSEVENMVNETVKAFGRLDCAFNNAGISESDESGTITCTEEEWDRIIAVNLKGVWNCMRCEIPQMLKGRSGAIVNTSSFAGLTASKLGLVAYAGSKHGVIGLTKTSAVEFGKQGIRINAICPGATLTPMLEKHMSNKEEEEHVRSMNAMHKIASPKEVAEAVIWLCSERASFVTGVALPVDGGQVIS